MKKLNSDEILVNIEILLLDDKGKEKTSFKVGDKWILQLRLVLLEGVVNEVCETRFSVATTIPIEGEEITKYCSFPTQQEDAVRFVLSAEKTGEYTINIIFSFNCRFTACRELRLTILD